MRDEQPEPNVVLGAVLAAGALVGAAVVALSSEAARPWREKTAAALTHWRERLASEAEARPSGEGRAKPRV